MNRARRTARLVVVAALGWFALVSQTLLFRDFFTAFDSNEIAIGAFFASWLGWIGLGALAGRFDTRFHRGLTPMFPAAALLYIPAFFLQQFLLSRARAVAGIETYDVFPLLPMLRMALLVNAPVSVLTGFLFTLACRWAEDQTEIPAARVYVLETLGSCAGGFFVTAAITRGMTPETVAIWSATFLVASASLCCVASARWTLLRVGLLALNIALAIVPWHEDMGNRLAQARARDEWARLLPAGEYRGAFTTAQGRYLYGEREGQFIVATAGGVCETLPPGDHAAEVAALHLAQRPEARSVLVVGGDALGVCLKFLQLPQVEHVAWHHPDPAYPGMLMGVLPADIRERAARVEILASDIAAGPRDGRYDLILLNLPEISTLALNRYVTESHLAAVRGLLKEGGAVSVRVSGGSNYMGGELALLGSSVVYTLGRVFENVAIKPGDETWVMAGDAAFTYGPQNLRKRYEAISDAETLYPPENIAVLYAADRVGFQMQAYREQIELAGESLLHNTERTPRALFFSLLVALKQAGLPALTAGISAAGRQDARARIAAILAFSFLLYGLLRAVYAFKRRKGPVPNVFDSHFLVFSTGLAGMALSIVLMFGYQSRFGSLFLDMGLLSALFMLGAFMGSLGAERIMVSGSRRASNPAVLAITAIAAHAATLAAVSPLAGWATRPAWALAFVVSGAFTGVYFPIAARRLKSAGQPVAAAGSNLELFDHLGGAAGALFTGVILLPLLGATTTVWLLALLVAVNAPGIAAGGRGVAAEADWFDRLARPVAYVMVGLGILALFSSHLIADAEQARGLDPLRESAGEMAPNRELREQHAELPDGSRVSYLFVPETSGQRSAYIFSSRPWAASLFGFAGKFELALHVDETGALQRYRVVASSETPMYLDMVEDADDLLIGRNVFKADPFAGLDSVTGATATADAFREALSLAGSGFARDVLEWKDGAASKAAEPWFTPTKRNSILLLAFLAAALVLSYRPSLWARRALMLASALVLGFALNLQYSTQQVVALLTLEPGQVGLNGPFLLLAAAPLLALLFGNLYCGYVCPFGALQEFATDLGAALRIRRSPTRTTWRYGRAVKYGVLLLIVVMFVFRHDLAVLRPDPLIAFFGSHTDRAVAALAFASIGLSLVFGRFWCRNLCPAGAFLALLNGARLNSTRILRAISPARLPARCDLGVRSLTDMDCICCDRCRDGRKTREQDSTDMSSRWYNWTFIAVTALATVALLVLILMPPSSQTAMREGAPVVQQTTAGQPRDLDIDKVRKLIRQGVLSDHPADFAVPAAPDKTGP